MKHSILAAALLITTALPAFALENNAYMQTNLVANKANYKPQLPIEKNFINAWGIAIRPAGAGGHFWVTAKDVSYQYVGDVGETKLHMDALKYVKLPVGGDDKFATSVIFNGGKSDFKITQNVAGAEPITAPAKFLFASDGGIISAWTERKKTDGTFDWPSEAVSVIDESAAGTQFFGIAINADYSRLYAADFGAAPALKIYNSEFKPEAITFDMPFDENKNDKVDAGEYAPFNVQAIGDSIFVAYAKTQACPKEEVKAGACKAGEIFAGEEDTSKPDYGKLAEFDEGGKLIAVWSDEGKLSAPWGIAVAPENFGALSGKLLVANFGSGTIAAFDTTTKKYVDDLRDAKGKPVVIDKIWGLLFGNGESLGDKGALYFTAGPRDEADGLFGSLRVVK